MIRWPLYPLGITAAWFAAAQGCALMLEPARAEPAESYLALSVGGATSLNTDQERYEASTNPYPTIGATIGRELWVHGDWSIAGEATCFWWQQRAHGSLEESMDGQFMAAGCVAAPVISYDLGPLALFVSPAVGPAYQLIDVTRTSQTGRDLDKSGVVLATELSAGVQVPISDDWFMRARGFWSRAGEIEQVGGGVSLAVRFDWFGS